MEKNIVLSEQIYSLREVNVVKDAEDPAYHMIARKRKTIAVCRSCHKKIHDGKIDWN